MNRFTWLLTTTALLIFSATAFAANKPNILVILADDLGYGELGCQGYMKDIPTPNIDRLAAGGTRFTSGYVSGPYCSPTRAGFMTGRYQQRFGHEFNITSSPTQVGHGFGLPLTEKTFGNYMQAAGYATGWIGKSHLGSAPQFHPLRRGFDEFFGFLAASHSYLDVEKGSRAIMRGFEPVPEGSIGYTTDAFGRETVAFMEKHHDQPWFCYLAFNAVHGPLMATQKYLDRFPNIEQGKRRTFAAMLSAMDDNVGLVMTKLRELGQEENTLVFFFSDNGGPTLSSTANNGPLRGYKSETWEGGIRIPFMVQWKGHLPAGKVDDRPVIQLDIIPTSLSAAGVEIKPEWKLDGVNLLPYMTGENKDAPHQVLYWRLGTQMALRMDDWKLVKGVGSKDTFTYTVPGKATVKDAELYNLVQDIGEKHNLAAQEPEKVKELSAAWEKLNSQMIEPAWLHMNIGDDAKAKSKGKVPGKGKGKKARERIRAREEAKRQSKPST